jgi:5-methylcytosine-specific restriction endonuclease McrA
MNDFEKINGYLFTMFEDDAKKPIIIDIIRKHLTPNRYHSEKIAFILNYLKQNPPYKNLLFDNYITNDKYFNIYITPCLKDIYNFDIAYEKNVVKSGAYATVNPYAEEQGHRYKLFIKELQYIIYKEEQENIKDIKNASNTCKKEETKKKKKKPIAATIKRLVWNTNIGEDIGKSKCMCCNSTDITQMSFNCGHIVAEVNGGDTIVSNLKPICQNCNSSMGTKNMEDFMKSLK